MLKFILALRLGLAFMFLMAGYAKLSGNPHMVAAFGALGLGQWFRYLTGAIEVGSGLGMFHRHTAPYAALLLVPTMIGAALAHWVVLGGSAAFPLVLLAAAAFVAYQGLAVKR